MPQSGTIVQTIYETTIDLCADAPHADWWIAADIDIRITADVKLGRPRDVVQSTADEPADSYVTRYGHIEVLAHGKLSEMKWVAAPTWVHNQVVTRIIFGPITAAIIEQAELEAW